MGEGVDGTVELLERGINVGVVVEIVAMTSTFRAGS